MSQEHPSPAGTSTGIAPVAGPDPRSEPDLVEGVLSKRVIAFLIDALIIALLLIPASLIVLLLGILTLGIAWLLFPLLFAIVALGYVALTLGGAASATIGMRVTGIEMRTWDGKKMFPLLAAMHALLFWFSVSLLTPLILLVGLFTERKQLLHDLIIGVLVFNTDALRRYP